jgi:hypothetical protein
VIGGGFVMDQERKEREQRERTERMNHMGAIPDERESGPTPAAMEQREGDPRGEPLEHFDERAPGEREDDV